MDLETAATDLKANRRGGKEREGMKKVRGIKKEKKGLKTQWTRGAVLGNHDDSPQQLVLIGHASPEPYFPDRDFFLSSSLLQLLTCSLSVLSLLAILHSDLHN